MKFEIDIDLPEDVLREWEPVAFRTAKTGECFWHDDKEKVLTSGIDTSAAHIILRRRFQWPAWLKCRYLTWDADGDVNFSNEKLEANREFWTAPDIDTLPASVIDLPFPGGDWRTRIEENPNWKELQ